jgi:hypothetical protein
MNRHALTLIEVLASLSLLTLIALASVSWISLLSRNTFAEMSNIQSRLNLQHATLLIEELALRSSSNSTQHQPQSRMVHIDSSGRLCIPTHWQVKPLQSMQAVHDPMPPQAASWAILHALDSRQVLMISFADDLFSPLGSDRLLLDYVASIEYEEEVEQTATYIRISITTLDDHTARLLLTQVRAR